MTANKKKTIGALSISLLVWLLFIPCAILNAALREKILAPWLGSRWALPLSAITLCLLILLVTWILLPKIARQKKAVYVAIGILWSLLTVLFETTMVIARGGSGKELLEAYDITTGNLWTVVVLFVAIAPCLIAARKKLFVK